MNSSTTMAQASATARVTKTWNCRAPGFETLATDLADRGDVDRVAARLADDTQPIDLLVDNAGFANRVALAGDDLSPHEST